jgi:hypothetical protein
MPQPRKHSSHAERQAAYRKRQAQTLSDLLQPAKSLPPLPAVSSIPGTTRWRQAMTAIEQQMRTIEAEMETYYDERSERWQGSDRGEDFQQRIEDLRAALELVTEWLA